MAVLNSYYAMYGLCIVIIFLLISRYYKSFKIYSKFPFMHLFPILIKYHVIGYVSKDIPFESFAFQSLVAKCQKFTKEGLVLTYLLRPLLIVFSEKSAKVFLNEKIARDKPPEYSFFEEAVGQGLITSNGERWKSHRKILNPCFQLGAVRDSVPLFNQHALSLVKDLETLADKSSVELADLIEYHYFNAMSESIFGLKQCEENKAAILKYFRIIYELSSLSVYVYAHPWLHWRIFNYISPSKRKYLQKKNELFNFAENIITEMEKMNYEDETINSEYFGKNMQKSLAYILLQHHLKDPCFTFEDLHAEVTTFMIAAYETITTSTMWCLFMLGLHPEVQEKAYNEVNTFSQESISYEESCNFIYLESVIMETLRLYPTIPFFGRQTKQEVQIGKYVVPKDTYVAILAYILHRDPDIYPDPEKFDPERFSNDGRLRNSKSYVPFAEGSRECIGKKFALIEMKIFLAYILRNFKITSLDKKEDVGLSCNVVLKPTKPLRMHVSLRSNNPIS